MTSNKLPIGVLTSHGGTNLQAIIDAINTGQLDAQIRVVICNNSRAAAIERARRGGIPVRHLSGKTHPNETELDGAIASTLADCGAEVVVLAGYMKKLGSSTLGRFSGHILNVHPALLPKFGGRGMYGIRVHQAVLDAGETVSGVSIHVVDEEYDHGPIVAQRQVNVLADDSAEDLAARVLEQEHGLYAETLQQIAAGEIDLSKLVNDWKS